MEATPSHHAVCAPLFERHVCCFVLLSPFVSVCSWVLPSLANLAANSSSQSTLSHSSSDITSRSSSTPFSSISSFRFTSSFSAVSPLRKCCPSYRLVESGLTIHCPCQQETGPVSSRQIHMSIVHVQLDHCSVQRTRCCQTGRSSQPWQACSP